MMWSTLSICYLFAGMARSLIVLWFMNNQIYTSLNVDGDNIDSLCADVTICEVLFVSLVLVRQMTVFDL